MSGIAAAQMQRNRAIKERNEERSFEVEQHKRVVNYGSLHLVCMDCNTQVMDDPHGRDILRDSECVY